MLLPYKCLEEVRVLLGNTSTAMLDSKLVTGGFDNSKY